MFLQSAAHALPEMSHIASPLPTGAKINGWQVHSELHRGRLARSYGVTHLITGRIAALEVTNAPVIAWGAYTERLGPVMEDLRRVQHPGALAIYDAGTLTEGAPYIVRELLDGTTLSEYIAEHRLAPVQAIAILLEICDVLIAAHAAGVVHGALELDHVLLVDPARPTVKLLDWGITKLIADEAGRKFKVGGLRSVAQRSPKTDIYALGLLAHQLLDCIPRQLEHLWMTMLSEDPHARPSIGEVARELASVIGELEHARPEAPAVHALPDPPTERTVPGWRHAIYAVACAAPLAVMMLGPSEHIATHLAPSARVVEAPVTAAVTAQPVAPIAPAVAAPVVETTVEPVVAEQPVMKTVKTVKRSPARAAQVDAALLHQYQRVGHDLIMLRRQQGPQATDELWSQFRAIRIEAAMSSRSSRQRTATTLAELRARIRSKQ